MMVSFDPQNMPQHVAIIMDGNGRWAKQQGKLRVFGHQNGVKAVRSAVELTSQNTGLILNIAANYGGYWDITQAAQKMAVKVKLGELAVDQITPELFEKALVTEEQPQVDLLIRTSGEQRISNFLLWQIAYAELFFTPVLWPDFDDNVFSEAIIAYQQRTRRFGGC